MAEALDAEITGILRRYLLIQGQENKLREEKTGLQEKLGEYMHKRDLRHWFPELDGQHLKVRCTENSVVEYNEDVLKERLGERYKAILGPDLRKIRRNLDQLASMFEPVLDIVGTPVPNKVRTAIEQGIVQQAEFTGAFKKSVKRIVGVAKVRPEDALDRSAAATEPEPPVDF